MKKIGVEKANGVVRVGILCDEHMLEAAGICAEHTQRFWSRDYDGPEVCEACGEHDEYLDIQEGS